MRKASIKTAFAAVVTAAVVSAAALTVALAPSGARAAEGATPIKHDWSFQGIFGTYDRAALQRGYKVYKNVCSACHSLNLIHYRNLTALGFSEAQVKALAAEAEIQDGPNDDGEMYTRKRRPADPLPPPFPNEKAAAAANGGKAPPDLSLITKARAGGGDSVLRVSLKNPLGFTVGSDYVYAILTGYKDHAPKEALAEVFAIKNKELMDKYKNDMETYEEAVKHGMKATKPEMPKPVTTIAGLGLPETAHFNAYFPGFNIAMPEPLSDGAVEFDDGTKATVEQMAHDVATFLTWTAEPNLEARKRLGVKVILFLLILTGMLYALKRRIWSDIEH